MPERIAKTAQEYAGRKLSVGDAFEVEAQHVALLLHLGRIYAVDGENGYVAREMEADESSGYRTREMKPKKKRFG